MRAVQGDLYWGDKLALPAVTLNLEDPNEQGVIFCSVKTTGDLISRGRFRFYFKHDGKMIPLEIVARQSRAINFTMLAKDFR